MSYQFPPELEQLVRQQMASGKYSSEDELLRDALESLSAEETELKAIEEALDELESGDPGVSLDEAFASLREKYKISPNA